MFSAKGFASLQHGRRVQLASRDMFKAYRQVPVAEEASKHNVIRLWHPGRQRVVYCLAYVLLFGEAGSVLQFNRLSTFIVALASRLLAIPVQSFFDDFRFISIADCAKSDWLHFQRLANWLGVIFDPKKDQPHGPSITMLGNIEDCSLVPSRAVVRLSAKPCRLEEIRQSLLDILRDKALSSGLAARVRGKLLHVSATTPSRLGRASLPFLNEVADNKDCSWSQGLERDLLFALDALSRPHVLDFHLDSDASNPVVAYTDASFQMGSAGAESRMCAIVIDANFTQGVVTDVSQGTFGKLLDRKTQIGATELLAIVTLLESFGRRMMGRKLALFVDNVGVIYNVVNGCSKAADLAAITFYTRLLLHEFSITPWLEHVPSEANLADGGSRVGTSDAAAAEAGVELAMIEDVQLPGDFPSTSYADWLVHLRKRVT